MKKSILLIILYFIPYFVFSQGFIWNEDVENESNKLDHVVTDTRSLLPPTSSLVNYAPDFTFNQGNTNMCLVYSLAYIRTTLYNFNKRLDRDDNQKKNFFSPGFLYWITRERGKDCFDPLLIYRGLSNMENVGIPMLSDVEGYEYYPYRDNKKGIICYEYPGGKESFKQDFAEASLYKIDRAALADNLIEVKTSLSQGSPCLYALWMVPSFIEGSIGKDVWTPYSDEKPSDGKVYGMGHAVAVIGYNDYKYGGAFLIQNSWGSTWGNNGRIWIRYDDYFNYQMMTYSIQRKREVSMFGTAPDPLFFNLPEDLEFEDLKDEMLDVGESSTEIMNEGVDLLEIELEK